MLGHLLDEEKKFSDCTRLSTNNAIEIVLTKAVLKYWNAKKVFDRFIHENNFKMIFSSYFTNIILLILALTNNSLNNSIIFKLFKLFSTTITTVTSIVNGITYKSSQISIMLIIIMILIVFIYNMFKSSKPMRLVIQQPQNIWQGKKIYNKQNSNNCKSINTIIINLN